MLSEAIQTTCLRFILKKEGLLLSEVRLCILQLGEALRHQDLAFGEIVLDRERPQEGLDPIVSKDSLKPNTHLLSVNCTRYEV